MTSSLDLTRIRRRSRLRVLGGCILGLFAALLVLGAVSATVQVIDGQLHDDAAGLVVLWGFALLALQGTRLVFRPSREARELIVAAALQRAQTGTLLPTQPMPAPAATPAPASPQQTVDRAVSYRQWLCQISPTWTLLAIGMIAGFLLLEASFPVLGQDGPQGFLFVLPAIPGFYLVGVLLYLPYRVRIRDGVLTAGVVGVPRFGRAWRSLSIDLAEVESWYVTPVPRLRSKAARTGSGSWPAPGRPAAAVHPMARNGNDLRGVGGSEMLVMHAAPGTVRGRAYPGQVMVGYTIQSTGRLSDGPLVTRVRRGRSLTAALHRALPGLPPATPPTLLTGRD